MLIYSGHHNFFTPGVVESPRTVCCLLPFHFNAVQMRWRLLSPPEAWLPNPLAFNSLGLSMYQPPFEIAPSSVPEAVHQLVYQLVHQLVYQLVYQRQCTREAVHQLPFEIVCLPAGHLILGHHTHFTSQLGDTNAALVLNTALIYIVVLATSCNGESNAEEYCNQC